MSNRNYSVLFLVRFMLVIWPLGFFWTMHRGVSAPSCCALFHRIAFELGSAIGFLSRADQGIGVFWHVAPPMRLCLEFPRETGLILMCARKVGNAFQTKQGNRTSCRDQEGRRVSDEVVREPRCSPQVRLVCRGSFGVASRVPSNFSQWSCMDVRVGL